MAKLGEVITVVTVVGEIIGRLESFDNDEYRIGSPRTLVVSEKGAEFAPAICMSGERNPNKVTINGSHIIFMQKTEPTIEKVWIQATSGIVV
jgi:hypothetical protein